MLKITKEERAGLKKVFENFGREKTDEEIFYDLCFCLCAPQTTFKNNTKVLNILKEIDFYKFPIEYDNQYNTTEQLKELLRPVRFYNNKTKYILEAKNKFPEILIYVKRKRGVPVKRFGERAYSVCIWDIREWLVKNIKGLGMKAASHFLRNLGNSDLAIIDTHIIKFLNKEYTTSIKLPISKSRYLYLETMFKRIAEENKLSVAELDSLIWQRYSETKWEDFKY